MPARDRSSYPRDGIVRVQTQPPVIGSAHFCQLFVQEVRHASSRWNIPYACTHGGIGGASTAGVAVHCAYNVSDASNGYVAELA